MSFVYPPSANLYILLFFNLPIYFRYFLNEERALENVVRTQHYEGVRHHHSKPPIASLRIINRHDRKRNNPKRNKGNFCRLGTNRPVIVFFRDNLLYNRQDDSNATHNTHDDIAIRHRGV